jgi:hypothetical protein
VNGSPDSLPNFPKKRSILGIAFLLVVAVLAGTYVYFKKRPYHVVITQAQIDATLKEKFPIKKTHLIIFHLTYSNPHVQLLPDSNRIEIGLDAEVEIKALNEPKKLTGTAVVTSGLTYNDERKQFFLAAPEVKKIAIQGIPQQYLDKVTDFASQAASEYLQEFPVYTLKPTDTKRSTLRLLLRDVKIKNSEVDVTLGP